MDGRPEAELRRFRASLGLMCLACLLSWVSSLGCSGTAGDEGTVDLIAAQEAASKDSTLAKKGEKFSDSLGIAPGPKRRGR